MIKLFLVRHGEGESDSTQSKLSQAGRAHADWAAQSLASQFPLAVITAPTGPSQETAAVIAAAMLAAPRIEPRFAELGKPAGVADFEEWRYANFDWENPDAATKRWGSLDPATQRWRAAVLEAVKSIDKNSVLVVDYLVINAVVGAALENDSTVACAPEFGSVTEVLMEGGVLQLLWRGTPVVGMQS